MSDDVKKALEWLRTLDVDDRNYGDAQTLLDHIDDEPARLAAAREEQREADARACPTCKGEGFTMRVRECPFCNDSTHDHECPTDEVKVYCACGAARLRATPLTATPLADRIAELEGERDCWKAASHRLAAGELAALERVKELEAQLGGMTEQWKAELNHASAWMRKYRASETDRDAALARVKELEGALLASCREKVLHGHTTVLLTDALRLKVPGVENYEDWGAERRSKLREAEAERDTLKAQLAEAVGVLRALLREEWHTYEGNLEASGHASVDDLNAARAFLAKYPERR